MSVSKTPRWNDRLRQERTLRNWRQQDLADHLGTTILTVQRWERGSHHPSAYFRVKLCALFGKSAEEFGFLPDREPSSPSEETLSRPFETSQEAQTHGLSNTPALVSVGSPGESPLLEPAGLAQERVQQAPLPSRRLVQRRQVVRGAVGLGLAMLTLGGFELASHLSAAGQAPAQKQPPPVQVPLSQRAYHLVDANISNWINHVAWSPHGNLLAVACGSNVLAIWDVQKEAIALSYPTLNGWVNDVSWSKDNWIAAATAEQHAGSLEIWRFLEATPKVTEPVLMVKKPYALRSVCWSPDGKYVTFSGHTPLIEVWDPFAARQVSSYTDTTLGPLGITRVKWSPSGRFLGCAADDGTAHVWYPFTGQPIRIYREHQGSVHDLDWSPDERAIVSCGTDKTCRVWDVASGRTLSVYQGHTGEVEGVDWSPYGTAVASASADKTAHIWRPFTGQPVAIYGGHSSIVETAHWSADETMLAVGMDVEGIEIWRAPR